MHDYKRLQLWQRSVDLVVCVYDLVKSLPVEEKFVLGDQIRRAVISIPSNIAEGLGRDSTKETRHFLSISIGSLAEIETQLFIASKLGYLTEEKFAILEEEISVIRKMLYRLSNSFIDRN